MRINEITTTPQRKQAISWKKILPLIPKHCSEFLQTYSQVHHPLFRFEKFYSITAEAFIAESPYNRTPRDTYSEYDIGINQKLKEAGFSALRNNSIFCYGSASGGYSHSSLQYAIFPINGFTYSWCPVSDLTDKYNLSYENWQQCQTIEIKFVDKNNIVAQEYKESEVHRMYFDLKEFLPEEFVKAYGYSQTNLEIPMSKNYEVCVHGKYFAVQYNTYLEWKTELEELL